MLLLLLRSFPSPDYQKQSKMNRYQMQHPHQHPYHAELTRNQLRQRQRRLVEQIVMYKLIPFLFPHCITNI